MIYINRDTLLAQCRLFTKTCLFLSNDWTEERIKRLLISHIQYYVARGVKIYYIGKTMKECDQMGDSLNLSKKSINEILYTIPCNQYLEIYGDMLDYQVIIINAVECLPHNFCIPIHRDERQTILLITESRESREIAEKDGFRIISCASLNDNTYLFI